MPFFSLFCIIFGIVILAFPAFLAYIIGFLFLFIGVNSFAFSTFLRKKGSADEKGWNFGKYEIIKKK